jgi:DNA invertase Pin-like site-specific DNA recombinase
MTIATAEKPRRAALYARCSTSEQNVDGQRETLRAYATARDWRPTEYFDHGVSGARERRPGLDALLQAVRRRQVDVVICTKLDRLARWVRHLVALGEELRALGVELVVLDQAVDTTTPGGRALFGMLAVFAEFEHDLIRERVIAGVRRARPGQAPRPPPDPPRGRRPGIGASRPGAFLARDGADPGCTCHGRAEGAGGRVSPSRARAREYPSEPRGVVRLLAVLVGVVVFS